MKSLAILSVLLLAGCATAQYRVVPVGERGAGLTVTLGQQAAELAANNYGKALSAIVAGILYKVGDNSGWWGGEGNNRQAAMAPSSDQERPSVGVWGNTAPVTVNIYGRDYNGVAE